MSGPLINVPREHFEQLASAPLQLAQLEAQRMLAAGDVAGANRRIAEGTAQAAAIRAQIAGQQPAATAPAAPAAPPAPQLTPEQRVAAAVERRVAHIPPHMRGMIPHTARQHIVRQAEAEVGIGRDPRFDPSQPMWLSAPLPNKPRI